MQKTKLLTAPIAVAAVNHRQSLRTRSDRPMAIIPVTKAGTPPKG